MKLCHKKRTSARNLIDGHTEAVCQPDIIISLMPCTDVVDNRQRNNGRVSFVTKNHHTILDTC